MFDLSKIFRSAWALYRTKSAAKGADGIKFSRRRFALCLFTAWSDAKLYARIGVTIAAEAAERIIAPAKAAAREQLLSIELQDHWQRNDFARVAELNSVLAA